MGIYIKDIKMPTNCHKCPLLYVTSICDGSKDCPLVPVPPHGDLIERNMINLSDFEIVVCNGNFKDGMKMILDKVENAPTIIPAETDDNS